MLSQTQFSNTRQFSADKKTANDLNLRCKNLFALSLMQNEYVFSLSESCFPTTKLLPLKLSLLLLPPPPHSRTEDSQ